jgi:hypothetical protein
LQIRFKTTVPHNVVILDSVVTGKEFDALQKQKQKPRVADGEEDSDAEEERLIEEAENERAQLASGTPTTKGSALCDVS